MADEYSPPLSPNIVFNFPGEVYSPPLSPNIVFNFGQEGPIDEDGYRKANYMILLTM